MPGTAGFSASTGDPEVLRDGHDRPCGKSSHRWDGRAGDWIAVEWTKPMTISRIRATGDSQLHRTKQMPCNYPKKGYQRGLPPTLPRDLRLDVLQEDGSWKAVATLRDNERRCLIWNLDKPVTAKSLRLVIERGWSADPDQRISLFSLEFGDPEPDGPVQEAPLPEPHSRGKSLPSARA
jgi:hypothetical protein